jgi:ATP-dependent Clp protease ATP-binding subunit ClpA
LDDIIEFSPVSKDMLSDIITIQLENFKKFVQKEKNITLQYDKSVIYLLAEK